MARRRPTEIRDPIFKATGQCRYSLTAIGKVKYYVFGLKPSIGEEVLEELRRVPLTAPSNLIETKRIVATKARFQRPR